MSFFGWLFGGKRAEDECEHEIEDVVIGGRGVDNRNDVEFAFTCPLCGERLTGYAELGWGE